LVSKIYVIDMAQLEVKSVLQGGNFCNGVAVRPDGKQVFISNGKEATVSIIDTSTDHIIGTVPVGKRPWNMAITPDGKILYVANGRSNSVTVVDTGTLKAITEIKVGELPWGVVIR
jgi:YVTN family beta-propeller protein